MSRPLIVLSLAAALAAVATLAGCGEGPAVSTRDRTVTIRLDEYRLVPQRIRARAGRLTIVAVNAGRLAHNVHVQRGQLDLGGPPTIQPGQRSRTTLDLRPGEYRLECTLANHDDLGQHGTLIVR